MWFPKRLWILLFFLVAVSKTEVSAAVDTLLVDSTLVVVPRIIHLASLGGDAFSSLAGKVATEAYTVRDTSVVYYYSQIEMPLARQTRMLFLYDNKPQVYRWSAILERQYNRKNLMEGELYQLYKELVTELTKANPTAVRNISPEPKEGIPSKLQMELSERGKYRLLLELYHEPNNKRNVLRLAITPWV